MIFYFSGTGNSQYIAERLAASEYDAATSIAAAMKDAAFEYEAECVGFVFPVYYWGLPSIVAEFIEKLHVTGASYVYCVLTCGSSTGAAADRLSALLHERGLPLHARFAVRMPSNYVAMYDMPTDAQAARTILAAQPMIGDICGMVHSRAQGDMQKCKGPLPRLATALLYPYYDRARSTARFHTTDECTGCGVCFMACPDEAIKLTDGRPRWVKDKCVKCMACIQRCPSRALQYGERTAARRRYLNPDVTR